MALTMSIPSTTDPNTTCFPSRLVKGVGLVHRKNCERFVSGPEFAMDKILYRRNCVKPNVIDMWYKQNQMLIQNNELTQGQCAWVWSSHLWMALFRKCTFLQFLGHLKMAIISLENTNNCGHWQGNIKSNKATSKLILPQNISPIDIIYSANHSPLWLVKSPPIKEK